MTYKYLFQSALQLGQDRLLLMEDDVILPEDWENRLDDVHAYLDSLNGDWDVFAGLIAEINPEATISRVVEMSQRTYIHLDRMVSNVCNIYNVPNIGARLAGWDEMTTDHLRGQFDRWLESTPGLRVITSDPWFAGHAEHLHSTLWQGGNNATLYNHQIERATRKLRQLVATWRANHG